MLVLHRLLVGTDGKPLAIRGSWGTAEIQITDRIDPDRIRKYTTQEGGFYMGIFRSTYEFMKQASIAHAKWDYEVSMSIIHNRIEDVDLAAAAAAIVVVSLADVRSMLGGKTAYAPAFLLDHHLHGVDRHRPGRGLITGCIGAGGGFIITPALMAAGVKGILAVGTDGVPYLCQGHHGHHGAQELGNVSTKLALAFLVGSGAARSSAAPQQVSL